MPDFDLATARPDEDFDLSSARQAGKPTALEKSLPQRVLSGFTRGGLYGAAAEAFGAPGGLREMTAAQERFSHEAGGRVTDVASKALPPGGAATAGFATNVGLNAIPAFVSGGTGAAIGKAATVPLQNIGRSLMGSALKVTGRTTIPETKAIIDTMLDKGISVTEGGVEKLRGLVDDLNTKIKDAIANSTETVSKADVSKTLTDLADKFKMQVNPNADLASIRKAWNEFQSHPLLRGVQDIPVQLAQDMKTGTYKQLAGKYGEMGSAETEAQKALARGLKEGIASKVPGVADWNAEESKLLQALGPTEKRVLVDMRKNPAGLSLLVHNPAAFAAFLADRSAPFKSLMARMVYAAGSSPGAAQATGAASGMTLYELSQEMQ